MKKQLVIIIMAVVFATAIYPTSSWAGNTFLPKDIIFNYFPLSPSAPGEWIVEPIERHEFALEYENVIQKMKNALEQVSQKIKPFQSFDADNEKWLEPQLVLVPSVVHLQGRPGETMAWYDYDFNTLAITWNVLKNENDIAPVFSHELGHWVWFNILTEEEKQQYLKIAGKPDQSDLDVAKKYQLDSDELLQEWFAEDFRVYVVGLKYENINIHFKSHGEPEKLKEYFSKFRCQS
ncbi:hypothetical protein IT084_15455 [Desulfallas sp. Bu1-1]|uniref:hypothetical protein n=1 Tax=Desulfallas sp. Bu1-1 TaxID=2787620 RepID=UPI00189CBADF|nr:hypothetical protein [Desulfallas sp. Bu1-1]MBF7084350.1 hypothetical protein [Desulfallas sp. Bu1-1]